MAISEQILLGTVQISVTKQNGLHTGTGYFLKLDVDKDRFVVGIATNKHVLAGGSRVQVRFRRRVDQSVVYDEGVWLDITPDTATFVDHPKQDIDVTFIALPALEDVRLPDGSLIAAMPFESALAPDAKTIESLNVLEDVVMVGHPIGLSDLQNGVPIVRRGTLATPYWLDFNGSPQFAIDIPAFWGSSGSPVFILNEGSWRIPEGISMGTRFLWLGMLWGGPQIGGKSPLPAPTWLDDPNKGLPVNIGYCIKTSAILEIRPHVIAVLISQGRIP